MDLDQSFPTFTPSTLLFCYYIVKEEMIINAVSSTERIGTSIAALSSPELFQVCSLTMDGIFVVVYSLSSLYMQAFINLYK